MFCVRQQTSVSNVIGCGLDDQALSIRRGRHNLLLIVMPRVAVDPTQASPPRAGNESHHLPVLNSSTGTDLILWWPSGASFQKHSVVSMLHCWSACTTTWVAQRWPASAWRLKSQCTNYGLRRTGDIQSSAEWLRQLHLPGCQQSRLRSRPVHSHCAR